MLGAIQPGFTPQVGGRSFFPTRGFSPASHATPRTETPPVTTTFGNPDRMPSSDGEIVTSHAGAFWASQRLPNSNLSRRRAEWLCK